MPRGPKPIPINMRILRGNPSRRPLPRNVPEPPSEVPTCPENLSPAAKREWKRITTELVAIGVLAKVDRHALALLCEAYATWDQALGEVRKTGLIVRVGAKTVTDPISGQTVTMGGALQQNPYLAVANKAAEMVHKMLAEFGMARGASMAGSRPRAARSSSISVCV